jgi:hypothetical protein
MAEPSPQQQQSFLERLMATIPDAAYRAVSPGTNLVELLRRFYSTPGTPAPAQQPAAPTESTPRPQPAPRPTSTSPVVTPGTASETVPTQTGGEQAPSLLETLRQNISDFATPSNSAADSLAAFASGVVGGRRQGFVQDLLAGIQAQQQFEAGRRAETRESSRAQAALVEADRKAMLEKAKFAAEAPLREAQANYYNAFADLRRRSPGAGTGAGQLTEARLATLRAQALNRLLSDLAKDPTNMMLSQQELLAKAQPLVPQMMTTILNEEGAGAAPAPTQPAVPMLNPAGRPTQ